MDGQIAGRAYTTPIGTSTIEVRALRAESPVGLKLSGRFTLELAFDCGERRRGGDPLWPIELTDRGPSFAEKRPSRSIGKGATC